MRAAIFPIVFGVALLAPSSAHAKTTYLMCNAAADGHVTEYRVSLDEDRSEVTYEVISSGNVFKEPAIFTADSVIWGDPPSSKLSVQFTISRIDLGFDVSVYIGGRVVTPRKGRCTISVPPKRAF